MFLDGTSGKFLLVLVLSISICFLWFIQLSNLQVKWERQKDSWVLQIGVSYWFFRGSSHAYTHKHTGYKWQLLNFFETCWRRGADNFSKWHFRIRVFSSHCRRQKHEKLQKPERFSYWPTSMRNFVASSLCPHFAFLGATSKTIAISEFCWPYYWMELEFAPFTSSIKSKLEVI